MKKTIFFYLALILVFAGCKTGAELENLAPETKIFLDKINTPDRLTSVVTMHWSGEDPDGYVKMYEISFDNATWVKTSRTDSTFRFSIENTNVEDVQFSTSVSEAVGNKLAASLNYQLDNFDRYVFGVSGGVYSGLSAYPYTFNGSIENLRSDCTISNIEIFNETSGSAGETEFRIERQLAAGGSWTTIFSQNCHIQNT